ncbi:diguanylate cyclase [Quadrisphaera sp. INWT6]|uniref:GGDEF domain-containing protein n=1 Tax=Quadrisphaera sp. INWT6 TaxID=2596917 RepID=UPI00189261DF|nr:diguanylate cyclase [Quadrisphaera sp. INWT6]MBF5080272.1 GGDEF domain-containing protein [Quadrisphaera sp. INWT6]
MTSTTAPRGRRAPERVLRRAVLLAAVPVLLVVLAVPVSVLLGLPGRVPTAVVGATEALVAAAAALTTARRGRRERGSQRAGWWVFSAACASWCAGQVAFAGYEAVLHREVPPVSVADAGFLGFSVLAPTGVLLLAQGRLRVASRLRGLLDGVVATGALGLLSWTLLLRPIVTSGDDLVAVLVSAAYPAGDVLVLAVATTVLARWGASRALTALVVGASLMALGDSAYVYLRLAGTFATGGPTDVLWTAAFAVMAVAAVLSGRGPSSGALVRTSVLAHVLPYVPFAVTCLVLVDESVRRPLTAPLLASAAALVLLVLARQALVVVDNVALTRELQERSRALADLAYSDPLTGVANRAAFTRALVAALDDGPPVVAAFCDLDSFKAVNDHAGHGTGDGLLVAVAARLRQVVRPVDVVARLGGDEFAVLVVDDDGAPRAPHEAAAELRERLETALSVPFSLAPELAGMATSPEVVRVLDAVSASVGAVSSAELGRPTAEQLVGAADQRMYAVKRGRRALR